MLQYRSAGTPMASAAVSVPRHDHSASNGERRATRAAAESDSSVHHHQQQPQHQQHSSSTTSPSKGSSRWRHDDIPKEKITQIFENELAKLREQETNLERAINHRGEKGVLGSLRIMIECAHSRLKPLVRVILAPVGQQPAQVGSNGDGREQWRAANPSELCPAGESSTCA